jgi:hypothetical protein
MGKYNSSRTRVAPVFDALMDIDPTGQIWLSKLLRIGSLSRSRFIPSKIGPLSSDHPRWWGKRERRLDASLSLLQWLVSNLSPPPSDAMWGKPPTRAKRERLVARDAETITEALHLLRGSRRTRVWYALEGQSQPDACIETECLLIVIEGKRTERETTTKTTWMPSPEPNVAPHGHRVGSSRQQGSPRSHDCRGSTGSRSVFPE